MDNSLREFERHRKLFPAHKRVWSITAVALAWLGVNLIAYQLLQSRETLQPPGGFRPSVEVDQIYAAAAWSQADGKPFGYRLMSPEQSGTNARSPLVVFLHGAGERGDDNALQLKSLPSQMAEESWRERFPCFLLAPQCPSGSNWSAQSAAVIALIEDLSKEHPIDRRRIYLTGYSMGGFGSWELAVQRPNLFAAVVPICGGGDTARAARIATLPIWAIHGDADDIVSVEQSRQMIQAVRKAGGRPLYTELEGVGHSCWNQSYRDPEGVVPWMFTLAIEN